MPGKGPDVWIKGIGNKDGAPYLYFDGQQAIRAGFSPGQKYEVHIGEGKVILSVNKDGSRTVSAKKKGERQFPVVDINSKKLLGLFEGMKAIRVVVLPGQVVLLPLASEIKKKERLNRITDKMMNGTPLEMGSLSHGGGVLSHAIHAGLQRAGIEANLNFALELREDLLMHAIEQNDAWSDTTRAIAMPLQEAVQDDWLMSTLPKLDVLEMGLPCSGASKAGKSKRGLTMMEDHPAVGHLMFSALVVISKTQPVLLLMENVVEYSESASAQILRHQMRDMGYDIHEAVLQGKDFGCLEDRVRWCMVATTQGLNFDFEQLKPDLKVIKVLGDKLDASIGPDDPRWATFDYLKTKAVRDREAGKGFQMQTVTPESTRVPTIRKGYHKGGSTDPLLKHPTDPDLLRKFTAAEHADIKEVPPHLVEGLSETTAHELLGQGIVYAPFEAVGKRIGDALLALVSKHDSRRPVFIRCEEGDMTLLQSFGVKALAYDRERQGVQAMITPAALKEVQKFPADFSVTAIIPVLRLQAEHTAEIDRTRDDAYAPAVCG